MNTKPQFIITTITTAVVIALYGCDSSGTNQDTNVTAQSASAMLPRTEIETESVITDRYNGLRYRVLIDNSDPSTDPFVITPQTNSLSNHGLTRYQVDLSALNEVDPLAEGDKREVTVQIFHITAPTTTLVEIKQNFIFEGTDTSGLLSLSFDRLNYEYFDETDNTLIMESGRDGIVDIFNALIPHRVNGTVFQQYSKVRYINFQPTPPWPSYLAVPFKDGTDTWAGNKFCLDYREYYLEDATIGCNGTSDTVPLPNDDTNRVIISELRRQENLNFQWHADEPATDRYTYPTNSDSTRSRLFFPVDIPRECQSIRSIKTSLGTTQHNQGDGDPRNNASIYAMFVKPGSTPILVPFASVALQNFSGYSYVSEDQELVELDESYRLTQLLISEFTYGHIYIYAGENYTNHECSLNAVTPSVNRDGW